MSEAEETKRVVKDGFVYIHFSDGRVNKLKLGEQPSDLIVDVAGSTDENEGHIYND